MNLTCYKYRIHISLYISTDLCIDEVKLQHHSFVFQEKLVTIHPQEIVAAAVVAAALVDHKAAEYFASAFAFASGFLLVHEDADDVDVGKELVNSTKNWLLVHIEAHRGKSEQQLQQPAVSELQQKKTRYYKKYL